MSTNACVSHTCVPTLVPTPPCTLPFALPVTLLPHFCFHIQVLLSRVPCLSSHACAPLFCPCTRSYFTSSPGHQNDVSCRMMSYPSNNEISTCVSFCRYSTFLETTFEWKGNRFRYSRFLPHANLFDEKSKLTHAFALEIAPPCSKQRPFTILRRLAPHSPGTT